MQSSMQFYFLIAEVFQLFSIHIIKGAARAAAWLTETKNQSQVSNRNACNKESTDGLYVSIALSLPKNKANFLFFWTYTGYIEIYGNKDKSKLLAQSVVC